MTFKVALREKIKTIPTSIVAKIKNEKPFQSSTKREYFKIFFTLFRETVAVFSLNIKEKFISLRKLLEFLLNLLSQTALKLEKNGKK